MGKMTSKKSRRLTTNNVTYLYGHSMLKKVAKGYCDLHKCYLDVANIREKQCDTRKTICRHLRRLDKHGNIIREGEKQDGI